MRLTVAGVLLGACALGASGCGSTSAPSSSSPPQTSASPLPAALVFSQSPIADSAIEFVVPIGNLNPPDHTIPTDHAYLYHRLFHQSAPPIDVVAPAGGVVRFVNRGNDDQLRVQATATMTYYLNHVVLDASIAQGMTLTAGQHIGKTSTLSFGLDIGVVNDALTLFFVSPSRYSADTLHADSPLRYFAEPIRSVLYAKERGTGASPDGRIDFDQAGRLAGNWFLEGLSGSASSLFGAGNRQLAFVRDVEDPASVRISIGGTLGLTGVYALAAGAPDPAGVTPASGRVAYRLFISPSASGPAAGLLIVEMVDASTLRAEAFPGSQASTASFTANAVTYLR